MPVLQQDPFAGQHVSGVYKIEPAPELKTPLRRINGQHMQIAIDVLDGRQPGLGCAVGPDQSVHAEVVIGVPFLVPPAAIGEESFFDRPLANVVLERLWHRLTQPLICPVPDVAPHVALSFVNVFEPVFRKRSVAVAHGMRILTQNRRFVFLGFQPIRFGIHARLQVCHLRGIFAVGSWIRVFQCYQIFSVHRTARRMFPEPFRSHF